MFYDAEHFFDGFRPTPSTPCKRCRPPRTPGPAVVILCDTNGGTLPEEIAAARGSGRGKRCASRSAFIATTIATWPSPTRWPPSRNGATQVQGTINGIGERCGNVDLISVIANLALKRGYEVLRPGSLARLTELSRYVYEIANMNFRSGQPFVGASAFAHKGGMHTHAVAKNTASYEHIDPAAVGNERRILVSELSGQSTS